MPDTVYYTRPVMCKVCDRVFDFPTFTADINERNVPVRTRICGSCLQEMSQNEEMREAWTHRDDASRRSEIDTNGNSHPSANGHKSLESPVAPSEQSAGDSDAASRSTESPKQVHPRLNFKASLAEREDPTQGGLRPS